MLRKTCIYEKRFYRDWVRTGGLHLNRIIAKESDLSVLSDKPLDLKFFEEKLRLYRWDIEEYIDKDRRFLSSLKPISVEINAPRIIKEMALASHKAGVGPMACVAGAIADFLCRDLKKKGYKEIIIENGGDIVITTRKPRTIGIYPGKFSSWKSLKLKIKPKDTPLAICTSSGRIGHSLSFGSADIVTVLASGGALADAAATSIANLINSKDDLERAIKFARSIKGVKGALIIFRRNLASWGKIEFVA